MENLVEKRVSLIVKELLPLTEECDAKAYHDMIDSIKSNFKYYQRSCCLKYLQDTVVESYFGIYGVTLSDELSSKLVFELAMAFSIDGFIYTDNDGRDFILINVKGSICYVVYLHNNSLGVRPSDLILASKLRLEL